MNESIKQNLTRCRIDDLGKELEENFVTKSRHKDIIGFFKKSLGDGPYYVISVYNDDMKRITIPSYYNFMPRNYSAGYYHKNAYSLQRALGSIDGGPNFPMIVQELRPRTTAQYLCCDNYTVYYVNADFLKEYENR